MKKIVLIVCNILAFLLLTGCFNNISAEEQNRAENEKKEAIPVIYDHFKKKYGIDVEIKNVFAEFSGCAHETDRCYSGLIRAAISYNDRTFSANIENQIVYDNYQAHEIEQACLTYALEELDLPQPVFYKIIPQYRNLKCYDFDALLVNDYFDGTNIEKIFNMVSPNILLIYESDIVFDSTFSEKVTTLLENTEYEEQSVEFIMLKKGSADEISPIRWYENTAKQYAPYVEYSQKYRKNEGKEPEIYYYTVEPLSNDLPILKEFLVLLFAKNRWAL